MRTRKSNSGDLSQGSQGRPSEDLASGATRLGLISGIIVALIGGTATILAAVVATHRSITPPNPAPPTTGQPEAAVPLPTCATCTSGKTFPEQASTGGAATFRDPRAFRGKGNRVDVLQAVEVVCRLYDPDAPPSVRPGWWYLLAGPPWNRQYYSPANSYLNGDPPEGPHLTSIDSGVPVC